MSVLKLLYPAFICFGLLGTSWFVQPSNSKRKVPPPPPPISQIRNCQELASLRVHVSDILRGKNKNWVLHWNLHGDAVLGTDLSKAEYTSIDEHEQEATILLPGVHLISSKVDHSRSMEIRRERQTWIPSTGLKSLRDEVWRHADKKIELLAMHEGYDQSAQLHAEKGLKELFRQSGWDLTIEWR